VSSPSTEKVPPEVNKRKNLVKKKEGIGGGASPKTRDQSMVPAETAPGPRDLLAVKKKLISRIIRRSLQGGSKLRRSIAAIGESAPAENKRIIRPNVGPQTFQVSTRKSIKRCGHL